VSAADSNQVGKRYHCPTCGLRVMCAKAGTGRFTCHGAPMTMDGIKPLPSTD
jgi:hypothetical protein